MTDKSCKTCAYHNPKGTLDDTHPNCFSCSTATLAGVVKFPAWFPKAPAEVAPLSPTARLTATELATRRINGPVPQGGLKFDDDKPAMALIPVESLEEVAKVLTFGAKKYTAHNWRKGFVWSRLLSACLRHVFAFMRGENKDPETGLSHLAHAICCLMFLLSFTKSGAGTDDRYVAAA